MTRPLLALLLAASLVGWGPRAPAADGLTLEPYLRIRVTESAGETVVDVPRRLLDALGPTGATVPLGTWKGRALRLSVDRTVRDLRGLPAEGAEKIILRRQTDAGPLTISAKPFAKRVPPRRPGPLWLDAVFLRLDGDRKRVQTTLPLVAVSAVGPALFQLAGAPADPDVLPLLEEGLRAAAAVGSGAVLDARAPWARLILSTR
ncbi:MAG: hypothetical protein ACOYXN_11645 [Acidobacteriota bacterium]